MVAATPTDIDAVTEECEGCDRRTLHTAEVEIQAESPNPASAAPSREPYRVSECEVCGTVEQIRMNNA
jgi:hypothetical protein